MTIRYNGGECRFLAAIVSTENGPEVKCLGTPAIVSQADCFIIVGSDETITDSQTGDTAIGRFIKRLHAK